MSRFQICCALLVCVFLSETAHAGVRVITAKVKPQSKKSITSIYLTRVTKGTAVAAPAGWIVAGPDKRGRVRVSTAGAGIPPGGALGITLTDPAQARPKGVLRGGDYVNKYGKEIYIGVCEDPLSATARFGGTDGEDYLGYSIPAGQWGYFYQVWNKEDFTSQTLYTTLSLDPLARPADFQVIDNTFAVTPSEGFDLGDLEYPDPEADEYWLQEYMEPEDATGLSGLETVLEYDATSGLLTMTFAPNAGSPGIGAGQTSCIVAFTAPFGPMFSDQANVSSYFADWDSCSDITMAPESPEPAGLILMSLATVFLLVRCRRPLSSRN